MFKNVKNLKKGTWVIFDFESIRGTLSQVDLGLAIYYIPRINGDMTESDKQKTQYS